MGFSRTDLIKLLDELAKRLNELEIKGSLQIVGGAAIALKYAERPPTDKAITLISKYLEEKSI